MGELETERLRFRHITQEDAGFIFELYCTDSFKRFIGDKNFQSIEDARQFIDNSLLKMYETPGLGLMLVEIKADATPIGICGLIKRASLEEIDIGFGYLPAYEGLGYGLESSRKFVAVARDELQLPRIVAITNSDNYSCISLLGKLGFEFVKVHETLTEELTLGLYKLSFEGRDQ